MQDAATLQNFASGNLGTERRHLELMFLTRGIHQLSRQSTMQEALETLNNILKESPTNLMALHGKVGRGTPGNRSIYLTPTAGSDMLRQTVLRRSAAIVPTDSAARPLLEA